MEKELKRSTVLRVDVPGNTFVTLVRFFSDHPEPTPVEVWSPWHHPWWVIGTYLDGASNGCEIVAYVESNSIDDVKKAWPQARDIKEIIPSTRRYTYTEHLQPPDAYIKEHFPKVWGLWAHCGMKHRWSLIIREKDEADRSDVYIKGTLGEEVIVDHVIIPPKPEDFVLWWMDQYQCEEMAREEDSGLLKDWPRYLKSEIRSMNGRPLNGRLWTHPTHYDINPNVPQKYKHLIDNNTGGIAVLRRDFHLLSGKPGYVTNHQMERIDTDPIDVAPADFRIWWMDHRYLVELVSTTTNDLGNLPDYLKRTLRSFCKDIVEGGQGPGAVMVPDEFDHSDEPFFTEEDRKHFDPTRAGVVFDLKDINKVRQYPGVITTKGGTRLETREFLSVRGNV